MNSIFKLTVFILFLSMLTACSSYFKKNKVDATSDNGIDQQIKPVQSTSPAVMSLIKQARADAINGDIDKAMLRLERAVRIEPANATVWHYMAKLYLQQDNFKQASGYASKSNSLAKDNAPLILDNWRVISHAKYRMGDLAGAKKAQDTINKLQE